MKIFVCFIKQACLQSIPYFGGGGVDDSILWLSFAQQKESESIFVYQHGFHDVALSAKVK
jgi:hypothetical protein